MEHISSTLGMGDKQNSDITLDMLDYKFIDECNNVKTLEKILRALRSGKDGYFPHLVQHCENKVAKLNPKSRFLRTENKVLKSRDLECDEVEKLQHGLGEWISDMKSSDTIENGFKEKELPPVRSNNQHVKKKTSNTKKSPKIKGSDFRAWDKYDAEEECKKVDDPEYQPIQKKNIEISHSIDSSQMNDTEKQILADKEKDKGNEAFKAGDFEEALIYYSRSISLARTAASVNNRALAYLRLDRYKEALEDCDQVLSLEKENIKAKLRRATALKELSRLEEAKKDLDFVLEIEPNNVRAKKILKEVKTKLSRKGRKMKIMEVEDDQEETFAPVTKKKTSSTLVNGEAHKTERTEKEKIVKLKSGLHNDIQDSATADAKTSTSVEIKKDTRERSQIKETKEMEQNLDSSVQSKIPTEAIPSASETIANKPTLPVQTPLPPDVDRLKTEAGELFRSGQYASAAEKYTAAIVRLTSEAESHSALDYSHGLAILYNNRAACKLKSGDDRACVADCEHVLRLKPRDVKALLRRASAYEHMEKYSLAYDDFRAAQSIDWTISQAQDGANRVAKHLREIYGSNWKEAKSKKSRDLPPPPQASAKPHSKTAESSAKVSHETSKNDVPPETKTDRKVSGKKPKSKTKANFNRKSPMKSDDKKRAELAEKMFNDLKRQGNELVMKGNFLGASEFYSQCIRVCPDEVAGYTNRALCFLKLKKNVSAVADCSEAIKLDANNVKAYYRRALANKNLKLYREAEKDLRKVLEIEPMNKSAVNELNQVQTHIQPETKRKMPIKEVSDDEDSSDIEEAEVNSTSTYKSSEPKLNSNHVSATEHKAKSDFNSNVDRSSPPKVSMTSVQSAPLSEKIDTTKSEKPIHVEIEAQIGASKPDKAPYTSSLKVPETMTPYEFGNLWNAVQPKDNVEMYKKILDNVPAHRIPSIVSNKTSDHTIVTFAKIARKHLSIGSSAEGDRAYDVLHYLTKADRFKISAMFLSKEDKAVVHVAFTELADFAKSKPVSFNKTDVDKLIEDYKL